MIEKLKEMGFPEIIVYKTVWLYKEEDKNWYGKLYEETTFVKLLQDIIDSGYSLPTKREWEYLAGKGCRSIFPWGNNIDLSMKLKYMDLLENDEEYTLEKKIFWH